MPLSNFQKRKKSQGMPIRGRAPLLAIGAIQNCLKHGFATSVRVFKSPSSSGLRVPKVNSLNEPEALAFLGIMDDILKEPPPRKRAGNVQPESSKDLGSFQPASMSEMPIPNPSSPSS